MYVVSACPLPVGSWLWQPQPGAWALTVICRATFLLRPVDAVLAPDQDAPVEDDQHHGEDDRCSLRAASDLAPLKQRADVMLVGHAFAPGGVAVSSLVARLRIGELDKAIEVHAERYFDPDGTLHQGSRFTRMPLHYERAAGGPDTWNPVGVRIHADSYGRVFLPNLQPQGIVLSGPGDHIAPVGFGPIAPDWPSRREKLGRHAAQGSPPDGQRAPLPEDLDLAFFNAAPRDQQLAGLRADERILLENLHPEHPRLVTSLPGLRPQAVVERRGGALPVALRCDTLWIDTDRGICTLTWRAQIPLESPEEDGRVVFTIEGSVPRQHEGSRRVTETLVPALSSRSTAASRILPFQQGGPNKPAATKPKPAGLPFLGAGDTQPPAPAPFSGPPAAPAAPSFGAPPAAPPSPTPSTPPPAPPPAPSFGAAPPPPVVVRVPPPAPSAPAPVSPARTPFWQVPDTPPPVAAPTPMTVGQMAANTDIVAPSPPSPPPAPAAPPAEARPAAASKVEARKAVQLIWFDGDCLPRVRRKSIFSPLLEGIEDRALDEDLDDPHMARDPMSVEDRRDVFEVMARAEPVDEGKLQEAVERGLRDDGKYVPPFLLVAGELRFPFDELAALKATMSIAAPFAQNEEPLKVAIADAKELLDIRDLMCPPGVLESFTGRIQEAFRKMRRNTAAAGYLEEAVERTLLERRSYQRRQIVGGQHIRALLGVVNGGNRPWPVYLPEATAQRLPMFVKFQARILAEAWLQEDQYEQHPSALKAFALCRMVSMPSLMMGKVQGRA